MQVYSNFCCSVLNPKQLDRSVPDPSLLTLAQIVMPITMVPFSCAMLSFTIKFWNTARKSMVWKYNCCEMFVIGAMLDYILVQPTVAKRSVDTPATSDPRRNSNKLYLWNIISQNAIKM